MSEEELYQYCLRKIDAAVETQRKHTDILYKECKAMVQLNFTKGAIDRVYKKVEAYYFNKYETSVSFGGMNLGSGVFIQYNIPDDDIDKTDENFLKNKYLLLGFFVSHLDDYNDQIVSPKLKAMMGKLWHFMYLEVKNSLNKLGYTLFLNDFGMYTLKKL